MRSVYFSLDEAEERFSNRESRPDDLELIHQLRNAVAERELAMKKLLDDKKYYQMELVNRETNFNKVFNSTPNVGVLNPMVKVSKFPHSVLVGRQGRMKYPTQGVKEL